MGQGKLDIAAIPQTAIRVLTSPAAFYREMPKTGGFVEPLVFAVVMGVIGGLVLAVLNIAGLGLGAGIAAGFTAIFFVPVAVAIGGFIGAAIMFVIWKLMGSLESYETAYRCGAYMSAISPITTVLGIIPYLGGPISILIGTFFIVTASVEVHRIPPKKAWLVFGIIAAVFIAMGLAAEFAGRRVTRDMGNFQKEMEKASKEAGKAAEELQKQAGELQKQAGQMQKKGQESGKAAEDTQKKMKDIEKMSPEEAQRAAEEMVRQMQKQQGK